MSQFYTPIFRLALTQHQRPTAMLMRDPHEGHRNYLSGRPDGSSSDWTAWDFAIASAMQIIEDSTTDQGHLIWEIEADDVDVQAVRRIDKAQAAIERITNSDKYKAQPGEGFVTKLIHPYYNADDPDSVEPEWQTREQWLEKKMKEL